MAILQRKGLQGIFGMTASRVNDNNEWRLQPLFAFY
jgi:hypothetical protein